MLLLEVITQTNDVFPNFELFDKIGAKFFLRLAINFLSVLILIRLIYYPIYKKKDYFFTYFLFNVVIFIITYLLNKVELSMGAAFGLFAVFSLLRYRTVNISAKDMTYLFIVIAIGLISAVAKGTYFETILINSIILTCAYFLDGNLFMKNENTQKVQYENIEMIKPENHALLIEDLKARTGLNIHRISISKINFMKDSASVKIYYLDTKQQKVLVEKTSIKAASQSSLQN
ncbi:MAG: DUF4956 domain-containing protein [Bacteroidetes bacterium]|nr:DUF4956 domain-containing protein [Bacteroidota bacterium]HET6244342.1 DUF4956 domain-containing protein [Bacteroidia bacterium]